jgi:ubiquinone biosynthesis protein
VAETRRFAAGRMAGAARSSVSAASDELAALLPILRRLPRRVDRIAGALEEGRLGFGVRLFADARDRRVVTNLLHQALIAFLAASTGLMGTLLLGDGGGPRVSSSLRLFALLGYCLLVVSFVLMLRVLVILFRPET